MALHSDPALLQHDPYRRAPCLLLLAHAGPCPGATRAEAARAALSWAALTLAGCLQRRLRDRAVRPPVAGGFLPHLGRCCLELLAVQPAAPKSAGAGSCSLGGLQHAAARCPAAAQAPGEGRAPSSQRFHCLAGGRCSQARVHRAAGRLPTCPGRQHTEPQLRWQAVGSQLAALQAWSGLCTRAVCQMGALRRHPAAGLALLRAFQRACCPCLSGAPRLHRPVN